MELIKAPRYSFLLVLLALFLAGFTLRSGQPALMWVLVLPPCIFANAETRMSAFLFGCSFYAGGLVDIPSGIAGCVPSHKAGWRAIYYPAAVLLLSLPWALVWGKSERWARCLLGVALGVVPPLGLIGFLSPLFAAGWLFPGFGLSAMLPLSLLIACFTEWIVLWRDSPIRRIWHVWQTLQVLFVVFMFAVFGGLAVFIPNRIDSRWGNVTTRMDFQTTSPMTAYLQAGDLQRAALASPGRIVVLPEGAVSNVSVMTDALWAPTFDALKQQRRTVLIGAERIGESNSFRNGAILRGETNGWVDQRVPVPLMMWHPFEEKSGVPLHLIDPAIVEVDGTRTGIFVCYEMVVPWPALVTLAARPQHLVGIANDSWESGTSVSKFQQTALQGWARLMGIESTFSANLPQKVGR